MGTVLCPSGWTSGSYPPGPHGTPHCTLKGVPGQEVTPAGDTDKAVHTCTTDRSYGPGHGCFASDSVGPELGPAHHVGEEGLGIVALQGEELWDVDYVGLRQAQLPLQDLSVPVDAFLGRKVQAALE